jgi:hypothetical protein
MKNKGRDFYNEESGSSLVLFAFAFMVIVAVAGLVIDAGILYTTKSHLKKTANAAVLSGAQELTSSNSSVNEIVDEILKKHGEEESLKDLDIRPDNQYMVRVVLEKNVQTYFMRLFNIDSIRVTAAASAKIAPMYRAKGAVPLGIDDSIPLDYMKEYTLKVDSGDSIYGNFGILALSGPGAKLYENDLRNGYDGEIEVGDIIDTQTGNVEGKTKSAIDSRINACPYELNDYSHRDCPRVVLILVYKPYNVQSNQMKQVKIAGFAYFYIKTPMNSNDSSVTGYFIKRAGTGFGDEAYIDKGAYSVRLTE